MSETAYVYRQCYGGPLCGLQRMAHPDDGFWVLMRAEQARHEDADVRLSADLVEAALLPAGVVAAQWVALGHYRRGVRQRWVRAADGERVTQVDVVWEWSPVPRAHAS